MDPVSRRCLVALLLGSFVLPSVTAGDETNPPDQVRQSSPSNGNLRGSSATEDQAPPATAATTGNAEDAAKELESPSLAQWLDRDHIYHDPTNGYHYQHHYHYDPPNPPPTTIYHSGPGVWRGSRVGFAAKESSEEQGEAVRDAAKELESPSLAQWLDRDHIYTDPTNGYQYHHHYHYDPPNPPPTTIYHSGPGVAPFGGEGSRGFVAYPVEGKGNEAADRSNDVATQAEHYSGDGYGSTLAAKLPSESIPADVRVKEWQHAALAAWTDHEHHHYDPGTGHTHDHYYHYDPPVYHPPAYEYQHHHDYGYGHSGYGYDGYRYAAFLKLTESQFWTSALNDRELLQNFGSVWKNMTDEERTALDKKLGTLVPSDLSSQAHFESLSKLPPNRFWTAALGSEQTTSSLGAFLKAAGASFSSMNEAANQGPASP